MGGDLWGEVSPFITVPSTPPIRHLLWHLPLHYLERAREALEAAKSFHALNSRSLLIDASPRAQPRAKQLAEALGSDYLAMPQADARGIQQAVKPSLATR